MTEEAERVEEPDRPESPERSDSAVDLDETRNWIGFKLDEIGGASIGRVDGVLVDAASGAPTWLIVRLGRFGRRVGVPVDFVAPGVRHAWVPYPRETIKAASAVDPAGGLSCGDERALARRYGVPDGSGRLGVIADRADEEPGSVPDRS